MDTKRIYETLKNFRRSFVGYTLKEIKDEYDNYSSIEVGGAFHKLKDEGYFEVEKTSKNDYKILKVQK